MFVANPMEDPLRFQKPVSPCILVIFGAHGDLTRRKLIPALYRLAYERRLPTGFSVVGISRTALSDQQFRDKMRESVQEFLENSPFEMDLWNEFERGLFYMAGDVNDAGIYKRLGETIAAVDSQRQTDGSVLFYLSTQPSQYSQIAAGLGQAGLNRAPEGHANAWRRLIVEKPFGHDLSSARQLSQELRHYFDEREIYRIDHYLGKETVQNILAFRFGNVIFEPIWNRRYINHVQITAAESIGVEGRGAYYQEAGALRDMIQNHMLQVLATMAMEPPAAYEPDAVRDERAKLLRALKVMKPDDVLTHAVAGQYGPAQVGGNQLPGFRQEHGVKPDAQTDTYAAVTLFVENWRWAGVPFYIRTGKRLPKRTTDIAIQFNSAPLAMFQSDGDAGDSPATWPNLLVLRIQPEEGISLRFSSKHPGAGMKLRPVTMDFNYGTSFGARSPSAY
ncbi:MAG: glucose-6-phosphate dehydrogenase, partial [Bryobacterales bacterium]|nr:glucose-6-phosphate dehydrogenase [Bryobacterales bacterium]